MTTWSARFAGRTFASPADFNAQLAAWLAIVSTRPRRALGCPLRSHRADGPRCWRAAGGASDGLVFVAAVAP
jgi:hypothetical protein